MLDIKYLADRRDLAAATGIALEVLDLYRPVLTELDVIDDGGEDCWVCAVDGALIELQWYGRTVDGTYVTDSCCRGCVGRALILGDVDPHQPVTVEYLPLEAS